MVQWPLPTPNPHGGDNVNTVEMTTSSPSPDTHCSKLVLIRLGHLYKLRCCYLDLESYLARSTLKQALVLDQGHQDAGCDPFTLGLLGEILPWLAFGTLRNSWERPPNISKGSCVLSVTGWQEDITGGQGQDRSLTPSLPTVRQTS